MEEPVLVNPGEGAIFNHRVGGVGRRLSPARSVAVDVLGVEESDDYVIKYCVIKYYAVK